MDGRTGRRDREKFKYLPTARDNLPDGWEPEPEPPIPEGYAFKYPCPCCGEVTFPAPPKEAAAYICPVCFWENDVFTQTDDEPSDENGGMSLNEGRRAYKKCGIVRPDLLKHKFKLLLFDLDDTLLRSDKTISPRNLEKLRSIQRAGIARLGVSTSRSEKNAAPFIEALRPDVLITSAGAHVRAGERVIFSAPFTPGEAGSIIKKAREIGGENVYMDADTPDTHYRNFPRHEFEVQTGFEDCVETDFSAPPENALMMCVKLPDIAGAEKLKEGLPFADVVRFVNSSWYKVTRRGVTKAHGIGKLCAALCLSPKNIAAFGDDMADIEMLEMAGLGVAMENALPEVKRAADAVIGGHNTDAIAVFLDGLFR